MMVMDVASIFASVVALYLVPILELFVNIPIVEAILMLFVALIIFPYDGFCGQYNSTFIIQLFICGLSVVEAMRIYSFMTTSMTSAILMVALSCYLAKTISVWILSIISSSVNSTSSNVKKICSSLYNGCIVSRNLIKLEKHHFAKGIINLYLLSASHMVIIGMSTVGFCIMLSVGIFRSTAMDISSHSRTVSSLHGALHTITTLCDLEVIDEISADELKLAIDSIRNKLYDHSFLIIEALECNSGEWEWEDKDIGATQGFTREHRKVDYGDNTVVWIKGISSEKYESYLFHIVASFVCLVFFVTFMLLGAYAIQKSIGKAVSDTLYNLNRYDNTTQLFNTSNTPPFYSVLHDDHGHHGHHYEGWWGCLSSNALWRGRNILNSSQDSKQDGGLINKFKLWMKLGSGTKRDRKTDSGESSAAASPRMSVESLDLEVAADHLIHLYQMKRDHHDVRRNGNIDRGQFVEASVSDWISSVFKQAELSVATADAKSNHAPPSQVESKRSSQAASKLPPIQSILVNVSESEKSDGDASTIDSFDGCLYSADHWKVDGTKLDLLLERIRSRDIAIARNAELNRRRKRSQHLPHDIVGGLYGSNELGTLDGSFVYPRLSGGGARRDRRVISAPQVLSIPLHHHISADRISAAGHWPMKPEQRSLQEKNVDSLLIAERNKLLRQETEVEEHGELMKVSSIETIENKLEPIQILPLSNNFSSPVSGSVEHVVTFENGWEDTFGGERIGRTNLTIDIPTPYHISLDSIKLDVLQLNIPQLKSLVTEVLKSSAPLPAPKLPIATSPPSKLQRTSRIGAKGLKRRGFDRSGSSFRRRVAAVVCEETLSPAVISEFVSRVLDGYKTTNPYHNAAHGADVCHTIWRFQRMLGAHYLFTPVEVFAQLVAALGHDIGHPGLNNNYLVSNFHPLAMSYHDESPLENMHCYELFRIINSFGGECDVFRGLGVHGRAESREIVVKCILSTDMAFHSSQVTKLGELVNRVTGPVYAAVLADLPRHSRFGPTPHPALSFLDDVETRRNVLEVLVHTADINNPLKPRNMAIEWTTRVIDEFCAQGDQERFENVPISPMCDRSRLDLTQMQLGFMDFVVAPLVSKVIALFPSLVQHAFYLVGNYSRFARLKEADLIKAAEADASSPGHIQRQTSENGSSGGRNSVHAPIVHPDVEKLRSKRRDLGLGFFNNAYPPLTPILPQPIFHSSHLIKSEVMASSMMGTAKELKRSNSWSTGRRGSLIDSGVDGQGGGIGLNAEGGLTNVQKRTKKITRLLRILISLGGARRNSDEYVPDR